MCSLLTLCNANAQCFVLNEKRRSIKEPKPQIAGQCGYFLTHSDLFMFSAVPTMCHVNKIHKIRITIGSWRHDDVQRHKQQQRDQRSSLSVVRSHRSVILSVIDS